MVNFISYDCSQAFLLPPDLRDWIGDDDLVHFTTSAAERVDIGAFKVIWRGHVKAQYHPRMMLALLIYCYANGIFSWRRIERATHRDVAVRFITAGTHPDHDTIAAFRRGNLEAFTIAFHQVLLLAKELKLLKLGMVSIDGTKIDANGDAVAHLEERGIEVLVSVSRPDNERPYDFRPPKPKAKPPPEPKAAWRIAMKEKLMTEDAKAKYKRRKCTVEPVFGIIKNVLRFNRFSLRASKRSKPNGFSLPSHITASGYATSKPHKPNTQAKNEL